MKKNYCTGNHILLADDDPLVLRTMKMLLGVDKHAVSEADCGLKALNLFSKHSFDLVITDFDMPDMDGKKLAAAIRKIRPSQPIILITAHMREIGETDTLFDLVLEKPFTIEALREGISRVLA